MADIQLENGYIRIATELMNEIIRRDFSKRQLAILHFIIRLSYGCHRKDCIIEKFNYFEIVGLNKSDIKKELKFLRDCQVIKWNEETMIFSINKDYEKWQINPSKGFDREKLDLLIHENIKNKVGKTPTDIEDTVGKIPTNKENVVGKIPTKSEKRVGKTPTRELVKYQQEVLANSWESKGDEVLKDSIKDISLKIYKDTTTTENPIAFFENTLCRLSPIQSDKLYKWVDEFGGKSEIVIEAIQIADNKNKRYFGFVEFLLKEWVNNKLTTLDRVRVYEQEKFNKTKANTGPRNKPQRTEKLPEWFEETSRSMVSSPPLDDAEERKKALEERLQKYRA